MRIIKPRTDEEYTVTCDQCGATIGYYETEVEYWVIKPSVGRFRMRPGVGFFHIHCPSCGEVIRLSEGREDTN